MTTVILQSRLGIRKEKLIPLLKERGIDVRPFFYPLSAIPAFRDTAAAMLAQQRNQNAHALTPFGINLPSALALEQHDVERACVC